MDTYPQLHKRGGWERGQGGKSCREGGGQPLRRRPGLGGTKGASVRTKQGSSSLGFSCLLPIPVKKEHLILSVGLNNSSPVLILSIMLGDMKIGGFLLESGVELGVGEEVCHARLSCLCWRGKPHRPEGKETSESSS